MWKRAVNNLVVGPELTVNIPNANAQLFQTQNAANAKLNQPEFTTFNGNFLSFFLLFARFLRAGKYILYYHLNIIYFCFAKTVRLSLYVDHVTNLNLPYFS